MRLLLSGALLLAAFAPAQANVMQLPPHQVTLAQRTWNTANGLPQNTATSIVQTRDGFVWIATYGGLCRLDGEHLAVFDVVSGEGLETSRFTCLFEGRDGTLWIGSDHAGLIGYRNGGFVPVRELPAGPVTALAEDDAGRLLVATPTDLLRREAGGFRSLRPTAMPGILSFLRRR